MKKIVTLLAFSIVVASCNKQPIEKPNNLIDRDTMEKILYDIALLQAVKGHDAKLLPKNQIDPKTYIYQKYKVDSAQFANSNKFYASDITVYKAMYDKVIEKINFDKKIVDAQIRKKFEAKQKRYRDSIAKSSKNKKSGVIAKG